MLSFLLEEAFAEDATHVCLRWPLVPFQHIAPYIFKLRSDAKYPFL